MLAFYTNTSTAINGTNVAQQINTDGRAVVIRKILIGNPVASGNIVIFTENNAVANNTTQIGYKKTYQASFTNIQPETVIDFRASAMSGGGSIENDGIFCPAGASIVTDQTMQVTVLYDYAEGN